MAKKKKKHPFHLGTKHEEHKALLFISGVVFGVAVCMAAFKLWYPVMAALGVLVVLWMIETNS